MVAGCRSAIGRQRTLSGRLDVSSLLRFAAAVGVQHDESAQLPVAHWAFFHEVEADAELGADGHSRPGSFLPFAAELPRRMFASTSIRFNHPLQSDEPANVTLTIADVHLKHGRDGDLLFVDVVRRVTQFGVLCVDETQKIVYRPRSTSAKIALPSVATDAFVKPVVGELWCPNRASLFRFSAATFNGHRIHYDYPYALGVEGYPDLVVHGPFIAAKLSVLAARLGPLAAFAFRALAPCFVDQPIRLVEMKVGELQAIRCDGTVAISAEAIYL